MEKVDEKKKTKKNGGVSRELAALLAGKTDPMEIAKTVSRFRGKQTRKRNVETERRKLFREIINNETRELSMKQMDSIVWEYAMASVNLTFSAWLTLKHPELFKVVENEDPLVPMVYATEATG